ncbi:hypothetical protein SANTM175S_04163 [Streptomyces antimycoticus]
MVQDHDPDPGRGPVQRGGGLDPAQAGHLDVQQRHIGAMGPGGVHDLVAAGHLRDDLDLVLKPEERGQRLPHHGLVLGQQYPDHAPQRIRSS